MKSIHARKAVMKDAYQIKNLVNGFARKGVMLAVSLNQVYDRIRDFWVLVDAKDRVVACGALKIIWTDLGEIRSLAVKVSLRRQGMGKIMVGHLLEEARTLGMKRVFVLTYVPGFFESLGFVRVHKTKLPRKIWVDCINCPKFPRCDEVPLMKEIV